MSVTDQGGWGEVERKAQEREACLDIAASLSKLNLIRVTTEDRLRGAAVEALSLLEQGSPTAAHQVLQDALKIGGVK